MSTEKRNSAAVLNEMPTIPVNQQGHVLYYEDTGAPTISNVPYTTLIVVHGTLFHGGEQVLAHNEKMGNLCHSSNSAVFKRLMPLAPQYNIRLVLVNRREYPGSSLFTEEDLNKLQSKDDAAHIEFARERAEEIATFIKVFKDQEDIPEASSDGRIGGVSLMGWSSGALQTIAVLGYADLLAESTKKSIEPYLRSYIVFGEFISSYASHTGPTHT